MFILMPFWSTNGGLIIPEFPKLNAASARPQKLFGAADFPYLKGHPRSKELLFEGEITSWQKKQFGLELPKWRLQSQGWTKTQWKFLMDWMDNPINMGLINFTCHGTDIAPGADESLGPEFVYPAYVLDYCIERQFITNEYQIGAITKRKNEELALGKDITEAPELYEPKVLVTAKEKGKDLAREALQAMKKPETPPEELFTPDLEPEPEEEEPPLEPELVEIPDDPGQREGDLVASDAGGTSKSKGSSKLKSKR